MARDQFALKRLSDEAMREILPAYQLALENILQALESLPETGSLEREFWLKSQLNTIERQLRQAADRVKGVLPSAEVKAYEEGLKNAEAFLRADGVMPPLQNSELSGVTANGQAVTQTYNTPGFATDQSTAFISKRNPTGEFLRPSITPQQVRAAAETTGFSVFFPGQEFSNDGKIKLGRDLSELLEINTKRQVDIVTKTLREGFLLGRSNYDIARRVGDAFGRVSGKGAVNNITDAVVRTSMAEASQAAHNLFYDANSKIQYEDANGNKQEIDIVKGYEWDATNDTRLCPICAPRDGLRAKERSDLPPWPAHWNCRCKILPITSTEAQLRRDGDVPKGSYLERLPAKKDERGRYIKPTGAWSPSNDNVYSRPRKEDGKMYWVRRKDLDKGKNLAGDMLQKMGKSGNFDSQRAILGTRSMVERFNVLTKPGGRYENFPQDAVRSLLAGKVSPPKGTIAPFGARRRRQGK